MVEVIKLSRLTVGQVAEMAKRDGIDPSLELEEIINTNIPSFAN